ncbi:MAG: hypothetical protein O7G85_08660, partial [Planctomycetota bacterium]|nr:hypothetical protein [Planctomycetota bacterium]
MNRRIANLMQLMLMSVLVTCVVMCCCQVHSFVLVMGEAQDTVSADMSGSCCSNCADEEASDSENEDSSAPEKSCRI